jgi:predicted dehydrogenase
MYQTIKWGIIGTGFIAKKFAEGLANVPNSELMAVASRSQQTASQFATEYRIARAYGSYEALVADADVDIVYVATPHNLHYTNTLMCLNAGKHVLCEKPFAVNGWQVREMIDKAREKKLFLMEALWSRFLPNLLKAKEIIQSGMLGEIKLLTADFGFKVAFDPEHRIYSKQLIGGSLMDFGIYPVFLSYFLLGMPKRVCSMAGVGVTDVDYNCSMTFEYNNELQSVLFSSMVANTGVTAQVHGTKGTLNFNNWWFTPSGLSITNENGQTSPVPLHFEGNGYNYEACEVVRCLLNGKTESDLWSWDDSINLIGLLDTIRQQCGVVYPEHDR